MDYMLFPGQGQWIFRNSSLFPVFPPPDMPENKPNNLSVSALSQAAGRAWFQKFIICSFKVIKLSTSFLKGCGILDSQK